MDPGTGLTGADYIVLGGGPAGCTVATYLARSGADVLILEAKKTPPDTVGESLIPHCGEILDELGVDMSGFLLKHAAVFLRDGKAVRFPFADAMRQGSPHAWQTPRGELDKRMRAAAQSAGVRFEHVRVTGVDLPGTVHTEAGDRQCRMFIDAGGRGQFLARTLGIREPDEQLRNAATTAWFSGVHQLEPEAPGDIAVCAFDGGWFWFIPFAGGSCSVGLVTTPSGPRGKTRWGDALALSPEASARLRGARPVTPIHGVSDFTSSASTFHGDGWALAGDAATFLDPVFSSGVCLGLHGGRCLAKALLAGDDLDGYETFLRGAVATFRPIVLAFYDGTFLSVAFAGRERQQATVRAAIISLLAGDIFDPDFSAPRRFAARMPSMARLMGVVPGRS